MTDAEPMTRHVWLPDGRSLCDRHAPLADDRVPTPEEFDGEVAVIEAAPACGACLVLVDRIRVEAAAILSDAPDVWPQTPSASRALLAGTRWAHRLNTGANSPVAGVDDTDRFDAFERAVDPADVERLHAEWAAERQSRRNALIEYWTPSQDTDDGT